MAQTVITGVLIDCRVTWEQAEVDVEKNTSKVKITGLEFRSDDCRGTFYIQGDIKVNGTTVRTIPYNNTNGAHVYFANSGWDSLSNVGDGWIPPYTSAAITHTIDGTQTATISIDFSARQSSWSTGISGSAKITLPTVPRASTITCSTAYIEENATIAISRASDNFTHTITYSFGSLSGTIATKTSSTSVAFPLPTTFYAQIPNAQSGWGTITCNTYSGDTLIGTKTCSFCAKCNEAKCKPTLSRGAYDSNSVTVALTGDNQKFIKYFSNATVVTNAAARNSATLVSQSITIGNKSINSGSGVISHIESNTFQYTAKDSRGFATSEVEIRSMIQYAKLTCSLVAGAATTAGVATLKISGLYWKGNFGAVDNTLTVQYRYKVKNGEYGDWISTTATISTNKYNATATISGLNYLNAYTFQARAVDKLMTVPTDEQTTKTTPVFDWSSEDFAINVPVSRLILQSSNGAQYLITINDSGTLITTKIT